MVAALAQGDGAEPGASASRKSRAAKAEHRAASRARAHSERRREKIGDPAHDREAKAEPLGLARAFGQALELLEDRALLGLCDADAAIPDLDDDALAASARTDEHAAGRVYLIAFDNRFCSRRRSSSRSVRDDRARCDDAQLQALCPPHAARIRVRAGAGARRAATARSRIAWRPHRIWRCREAPR